MVESGVAVLAIQGRDCLGAAEIKKSLKRIFIFFLICPNLESAGLRNYLSKNSGLNYQLKNFK